MIRARAIGNALWYGLLPWQVYEDVCHYAGTSWAAHAWLNLRLAGRWLAGRQTLGDLRHEYDHLPRAVVVVVRRGVRVLAVSRKGDPDDLGLPGGKVEPGETPEAAAVREAREETGYTVRLSRRLLTRPVAGHLVIGYEAHTIDAPRQPVSEGGSVCWVPPCRLSRGSFADYNRRVLTRAGLLSTPH